MVCWLGTWDGPVRAFRIVLLRQFPWRSSVNHEAAGRGSAFGAGRGVITVCGSIGLAPDHVAAGVACADLLVDLVEAERRGDRDRYRFVVDALTAEKRAGRHHLLADGRSEIRIG